MDTQVAPHRNDAAPPAAAGGVAIEGRDNPGVGLNVSPAAVQYAKKRLHDRGTPNAAIRLGVRGGGCSGFSYVIEFSDDPPRERDSVGSADGVTFYVDKKSLVFLNGSTLDYTKSLMFQGFRFLNPQEASKCGCGHSFTVK
jgi:iron-sulfur cluster assembly protein